MGKRPELSRRGALLAAASLACTVLCVGCGEVHARLSLGPARPVTVAVEGPPSALYAPFYTAAAEGDFAAGALAVKVVEAPADDSLAALESGHATVAVTSEPELLAARATGAQLVAIAALTREPLEGIVSLAGRPVTRVAALAGHTVAVASSRLAAAALDTVLTHAGLTATRVRTIAAPAGLAGALREHQAIATLGAPWPLEWGALFESASPPAAVISLPAAGVPAYSGLIVVARIGEAHHQGPLLRALLQSLSRGQRAVAADPRAAASVLAAANAQISEGAEQAAIGQLAPRANPTDATKPFGYEYPSQWHAFATWMHQYGLLPASAVAASGLAITNEFLPGQGA